MEDEISAYSANIGMLGYLYRHRQILYCEDRIPEAVRIGYAWAIPDNALKPKDARMKSRKYIKSQTD